MATTDQQDERLVVRRLGSDTWPAFEAMLESSAGMFRSCWCTWFHEDPERGITEEGNRRLKRRWVHEGSDHAALVMDGEQAVAWAQYGTPAELPHVHHQKKYEAARVEAGEALPDFRVTCIFVDKRRRGDGLAALALRGALDQIAEDGGGVVEGYPEDIAPGVRKSASFVYNGTRAMYEAAGFTWVRAKGLNHTVMRRVVDPA